MKLLGVVFAIVLLFLPLSVTLEAQVEPKNDTVIEEQGPKAGTMTFLRKKIMERLEKMDAISELEESKPDTAVIKSKIGIFQKKLEDILKKLNNTES